MLIKQISGRVNILPFMINSSRSIITWRQFREKYRKFWAPRNRKPPYNHITQIGDPILRGVSQPVRKDQIESEEICEIIKILKQMLRVYEAVSMSAPQIGVPLRIFVMEYSKEKKIRNWKLESREVQEIPLTVLINPEMKVLSYEKIVLNESCESIQGYSADVPRYSEVEITGLNENAEHVSWKASGLPARIIQHEMDHLNGRLYTDVMLRNTFECTSWGMVNKKGGKIVIPFRPPKIKIKRLRFLMSYY